jgi:hypothetical protein
MGDGAAASAFAVLACCVHHGVNPALSTSRSMCRAAGKSRGDSPAKLLRRIVTKWRGGNAGSDPKL